MGLYKINLIILPTYLVFPFGKLSRELPENYSVSPQRLLQIQNGKGKKRSPQRAIVENETGSLFKEEGYYAHHD
jgi:hypothetical protein